MKFLIILFNTATNGYSDNKELSILAPLFIILSLLSICLFAFDATISLSAFEQVLNKIGKDDGTIPFAASVGLAVAALGASTVGAKAVVRHRRSKRDNGQPLTDSTKAAALIAGFLYLLLAGTSLYANWLGAKQAAERTASAKVTVTDDPLLSTANEWTNEKQATTARYDHELTELKSRINAIETGTSKEQGKVNGKRGNVTWQGNLTAYGRALLAELRQSIQDKESERAASLAALDATYQTRLDVEQSSYNTKKGKHEKEENKAKGVLAWFVALIYPLGILIGIYNAFFLSKLDEYNQRRGGEASTPTAMKSPVSYTHLATNTASQIGFKQPYMQSKNDTLQSFNPDKFKADLLHEIKDILADRKETHSPVKGDSLPPVEFQFSSTKQPDRKAPLKHGKRADSIEARAAILAAFRAIRSQGKKPTYSAISKATNYSIKTVGNHVREMKRERII